MPGAASIMAGMTFVKITTDNSELVKGLERARGKIAAFRDSVKTLYREMAVLAAAEKAAAGKS